MIRRTAAIAALGCLALAACDDPGEQRASGGGAGNRICTPFPGEGGQASAAPAGPMEGRGAVDDCLHRWSYALAASPDPADHVAQAAVAACSGALARWNQQALAPTGPGDLRPPSEAPSLLTGEDTNPVSERYNFASGRALFYVVQARAGKCPAPSMKDGEPEGRRY
ncbi:hypothetical protein [Phenylobacterium sp.]|jgi:hypothetical protein|uniref:hypothetical protein n=1 Tax=Phenylobacterium sp. TaxID=1871053 RepID=UPI002F9457AB